MISLTRDLNPSSPMTVSDAHAHAMRPPALDPAIVGVQYNPPVHFE